MTEGRVTATSLNLRDAPNGTVVGMLRKGDSVSILETKDGWLRVSATGGTEPLGWVSAEFVATTDTGPLPASPLPPPADDASHQVTVAAGKAIGPDGKSFAVARGDGFATLGLTTLGSWLAGGAAAPDLAPSVVRAVRAVSMNEGRLEAINSYDNAFLSFGLLQWTAGPGSDPGELAGLLDLVQRTSAAAFGEYFGRYGLGVQLPSTAASSPATGFLTLSGAPVRMPTEKAQLRDATWAYRFWRAGHDETVRACEAALAASRIGTFLQRPAAGHTVGDWLTSEYGVALVLDEHVNRPGHVPRTLESAIASLSGTIDLSQWGDREEANLIDRYIAARDGTNMTDAANRAIRIGDCVHRGELSDRRGSFVSTAGT
jgi:hypothetical protein